MHRFIPLSSKDKRKMYDSIGINGEDELFSSIPEGILDCFDSGEELNEKSRGELSVEREVSSLARKNSSVGGPVFLGAGAYHRFVPAVVDHALGRSEFYTAYTPYQAEVSQGTLQTIFEYQSIVCSLSGMAVSNASHYDCATAMAESVLLSSRVNRKKRVALSKGVNPRRRRVVKTYADAAGLEILDFDLKDGRTVLGDALDDFAAVVIENPNFLGVIEDLDSIKARLPKKCHLIVSFDPISIGLLDPPGRKGADIAVGEGLGCGLPLNAGGPGLGFMAVSKKLMRKIPGRIVGRAKDVDGQDAFVLTLQAREQHIRRSGASSNICTNQALCALAASVYFSSLGAGGLKDLASLEFHRAHNCRRFLIDRGSCRSPFNAPFFNEFPVIVDKPVAQINEELEKEGMVGGYDLSEDYPELGNSMLVAVTETVGLEDIERFVTKVGEINAK
mgnify:CR=1 FL=1